MFTPTSAGLQEVDAEVVTTELLIVMLKVVIESQVEVAPLISVSLKLVEAKYQVPSTCTESQAVKLDIPKLVGIKLTVS